MVFAKRITTRRIRRIVAAAFMAVLVYPIRAQSKGEKEAAVLKYKGKFLFVKRDGIAVGVMSVSDGFCAASGAVNTINDTGIQVSDRFHCGVEPIHKGEVLHILNVNLVDVHRGPEKGEAYLDLFVENVSSHSITRGIGAFAHPSLERGKAAIAIHAGQNGLNFNAADTLAAQWFTLRDGTDSVDGAQLGNTAAGVFVNQVKTGMSFVEVESALGLPQTRVDLGEKALYKYKDMTVEFHDAKVADVR